MLNTTAPGATPPSFETKVDFATGSYPTSVAIGDFNGDGKLDLATANGTQYTGNVSILLDDGAAAHADNPPNDWRVNLGGLPSL